ncbi:MAG: metalloregulator ArsR/SmtB family transcription factor [Pseudomonadota bacterium]
MFSDLEHAAATLRALGDSARLRLLALCQRGEQSVGDLAAATALSQPRVSQHLKVLAEQGLLERFRDGQRIYYRESRHAAGVLALLGELLPTSSDVAADIERLRSNEHASAPTAEVGDRALNRAVLDCLLARPVGRLLDIGAGEARMLSLLSGSAVSAIGVDTDRRVRHRARRRLGVAGLANCTIRAAAIESLPFDARQFDTVIVDDVLRQTDDLSAALSEAARVLASDGIMLIIERDFDADANRSNDLTRSIASAAADVGLRLAPGRRIAGGWRLATATVAQPTAPSQPLVQGAVS